MTTTFIGVDLAWQSDKNHSGLAVLHGDRSGASLSAYSTGIATLNGVVDYILAQSTTNTVVAIDAPLIINNLTGQRPCETLIAKKFGRYHASAHTSNLTRFPQAGSVQLVQRLAEAGFTHAPNPASDQYKTGRWCFEVYPHPAQVVLFNLERIIKYKNGRVADKRAGLERLRRFIRTRFGSGDPPLQMNDRLEELLAQPLEPLTGRALKHYEDTLDALVCAYLALFYWAWGATKNEMIGDLETGYIINPTWGL